MAFSLTAARQVRRQSVWFLAGLGVAPEVQRAGVGGRLMQPVLARADADATQCLLNTQNQPNIGYYRRFGFDVAVDAWRAGHGPTSWTMRRPPGGAPDSPAP
jgi:predicted N-acetyltransferase YhbS